MTIISELEQRLKERGVSRRELARSLGWHDEKVARWFWRNEGGNRSTPRIGELDLCFEMLGREIHVEVDPHLPQWVNPTPLAPTGVKIERERHHLIEICLSEMKKRNISFRLMAKKSGHSMKMIDAISSGKADTKAYFIENLLNAMGLKMSSRPIVREMPRLSLDNREPIGPELIQEARRLGMTMQELADASNVCVNTLWKISSMSKSESSITGTRSVNLHKIAHAVDGRLAIIFNDGRVFDPFEKASKR